MSSRIKFFLTVAALCVMFVAAHAKPYFGPRGPISLISCYTTQIKAEKDKSDWIPKCKDQGMYYTLEQCNHKGNLCWCSDLWGEKLNNPQPKKKDMCKKPCFKEKSREWNQETKCDREGFFQRKQAINYQCFCYSKDGKVRTRIDCNKWFSICL